MNIALIGGAGFIGTNLAIYLSKKKTNHILVVDRDEEYFNNLKKLNIKNIKYLVCDFEKKADFDLQVSGQDIVYHMASTNFPGNSNKDIANEIEKNIGATSRLLDACIRQGVKKVVFISSGGAVYGKVTNLPINENATAYPITTYGIQKLTIEKLFYLYNYQYGLDYRVVRLANPYGPFQRPNGKLGVITNFIYRALTDGLIEIYGDGDVIRDFIYIDNAVEAIVNITNCDAPEKIYNVGSGYGTSINEIVNLIKEMVNPDLTINHIASRSVDVKINYLDMSRYYKNIGEYNKVSLQEGILKTANFLEDFIKEGE